MSKIQILNNLQLLPHIFAVTNLSANTFHCNIFTNNKEIYSKIVPFLVLNFALHHRTNFSLLNPAGRMLDPNVPKLFAICCSPSPSSHPMYFGIECMHHCPRPNIHRRQWKWWQKGGKIWWETYFTFLVKILK